MIYNYDGAAVMAENNWWQVQINCQPPRARYFHGPVDSFPRICLEPYPARQMPEDLAYDASGVATPILRMVALPNPTIRSTVLHYVLPGDTRQPVRLAIYDVRGRQVAVLVDRDQDPGVYEVGWGSSEGRGAASSSGIYFAKLSWSGSLVTTKILLAQ